MFVSHKYAIPSLTIHGPPHAREKMRRLFGPAAALNGKCPETGQKAARHILSTKDLHDLCQAISRPHEGAIKAVQ